MNRIIDLRSDTVTKPTEEMRKAMYEAEVGDDVMREDPTVNRLEALGAEMTGREASIFVPSGTFGNQLALFTICERRDEVILSEYSHIRPNNIKELSNDRRHTPKVSGTMSAFQLIR